MDISRDTLPELLYAAVPVAFLLSDQGSGVFMLGAVALAWPIGTDATGVTVLAGTSGLVLLAEGTNRLPPA